MSLIESGRQTKEPKGLTCNTNFMARRDPTVTTRRKASAESMKRKVEPVTHRKTRNGTALAINTSTLRSRWRVVKIEDEMRWKITLLVAEINRIDKENQKLKSMFKRVSCTYNHLQKHIRSMLQQQKEVDGSQIFYRDHRREDTLCPWSVNVDSSSAISYQSGQQLISKKRKNGMINSSTGEMEDLPNKKFQVLTTDLSSQYTAAAPKRSVSVQTRSEAAVSNQTSDGCQWRKYGQKMTRNNEHPRCYYRCAMAPGCPVKKQVQRCAQDPTKVITTYKGEHTHSLTSATAAMHCSSIQLNGEGMKIENFLVDNQSIPCIARISTSSTVPTITLDLTDCNRCNRPGLQLQPAHLEAGSFQHLTSSSNIMGQALDYHNQLDYYSSIMQNSVASIKEIPPATQFSHGSTQ